MKDLKDQSFSEIESPIRKRPAKLETPSNILQLQQPCQEDIQSIVQEFTPKNTAAPAAKFDLIKDIVKEFTPKSASTPKNDDIQSIVREFSPMTHSRKSSSTFSNYSSNFQQFGSETKDSSQGKSSFNE